jgi:ribosomal protein L11 methyltransferase
MTKVYFELEIAFNEATYDAIYNRLYASGITTILEDNGTLKIYLQEEELSAAETIKDDLINLDGISPAAISIEKYDNKDWNQEWEKTIEPIYIKDKIIIFPSWKREIVKDSGRILIEIDPKMSFGTGHNETTQLILGLMCDYIEPEDKSMLDYGCGTAILAIAGIKLGINEAVAIDIDLDSIENAKEYILNNDTAENIKLFLADITGILESNFDLITANITSGVIIPNLANMYNKLKPGGKLFITGILNGEAESLVNELTKNNFILKELRSKEEWSGFYCIKK